MSTVPFFLERLGLKEDADERAIRRAYGRELKQIDQETDTFGFQQLRECYEAALEWVKYRGDRLAGGAAQSDSGTLSYAVPQVTPVFHNLARAPVPSTAPAQSPPLDLHQEAVLNAEAAFAAFMQQYQASPVAGPLYESKVHQALEDTLASESLISMLAREHFERRIAELLVQGWQLGHEVLFVCAVKVFDWDKDRRRLLGLGHFAVTLDQALMERAIFEMQPVAICSAQRTLIQRLRTADEPSHKELIAHLEELEILAKRFPTWLAIITDIDRINQWRMLDQKVPAWKRKFTKKSTDAIALPAEQTESSPWRYAWVILIIIGALSRIGGGGSSSTQPQFVPSYSNSSSVNQPGYQPPPEVFPRLTQTDKMPPLTTDSTDFLSRSSSSSSGLAFAPATESPFIDHAAPRIKMQTAVEYPTESRRAKEEGKTILRLLVHESGSVESVKVQLTSGYARLDKSAETAVWKWRFHPYTKDGKPAKVYVFVPVVFELKS